MKRYLQRIHFLSLKAAGFTTLLVHNLLGQEVTRIVHQVLAAGDHSVDFNAGRSVIPSGMYFYTLASGTFRETRKMILTK